MRSSSWLTEEKNNSEFDKTPSLIEVPRGKRQMNIDFTQNREGENRQNG